MAHTDDIIRTGHGSAADPRQMALITPPNWHGQFAARSRRWQSVLGSITLLFVRHAPYAGMGVHSMKPFTGLS